MTWFRAYTQHTRAQARTSLWQARLNSETYRVKRTYSLGNTAISFFSRKTARFYSTNSAENVLVELRSTALKLFQFGGLCRGRLLFLTQCLELIFPPRHQLLQLSLVPLQDYWVIRKDASKQVEGRVSRAMCFLRLGVCSVAFPQPPGLLCSLRPTQVRDHSPNQCFGSGRVNRMEAMSPHHIPEFRPASSPGGGPAGGARLHV